MHVAYSAMVSGIILFSAYIAVSLLLCPLYYQTWTCRNISLSTVVFRWWPVWCCIFYDSKPKHWRLTNSGLEIHDCIRSDYCNKMNWVVIHRSRLNFYPSSGQECLNKTHEYSQNLSVIWADFNYLLIYPISYPPLRSFAFVSDNAYTSNLCVSSNALSFNRPAAFCNLPLTGAVRHPEFTCF